MAVDLEVQELLWEANRAVPIDRWHGMLEGFYENWQAQRNKQL